MVRHFNRMKKSGSPDIGEPEYIVIGKLQRTHGVTGEIVLGIQTDFPERITSGKTVFLGKNYKPFKITGTRPFNNNMLITLDGIKNREEAAELTNLEMFVLTKDLPELADGRYYHHQLIGMTVVDDNEQVLGNVRDIIVTGANDVYIIQDEKGIELLLPAVDSVIVEVNLNTRTMRVKPPEWE